MLIVRIQKQLIWDKEYLILVISHSIQINLGFVSYLDFYYFLSKLCRQSLFKTKEVALLQLKRLLNYFQARNLLTFFDCEILRELVSFLHQYLNMFSNLSILSMDSLFVKILLTYMEPQHQDRLKSQSFEYYQLRSRL